MSAGAVSIPYRADIDGLRAVCVVSVILFHAGVPGFSGGYVGVDVFFVVSGYLITLLLIAPSDVAFASRIADFYLRRGRRILPALLALLIVSAATASVLFLPYDLWRFGRSLTYAAALVGNVGAWIGGGYFDLGERFAPLQHLWSIGVEEQFYLAYPLLLLLVGRYFTRYRASLIVALTALSLALCLWASSHAPVANFYLFPTRAWQLLCGALVALGAIRTLSHRAANEALAALSLGVLALTVGLYRPETPYPGLYAVVPTVAATLLIATAATRATMISRLLSVRPLVFTGLISYSLYLWHAPILAFSIYYNIEEPTAIGLVGLLIVIYLISVASWSAIERPFRSRSLLKSGPSFAAVAFTATLALCAAGLALWASDGLPQRFAGSEVEIVTAGSDQSPTVDPSCTNMQRIEAGQLCSYGPEDEQLPKVVVWGDSHAYVLLPAYEALAASHRIRLYYGFTGGCRPLTFSVVDERNYRRARCARFNAAMTQAVRRLDPKLVVLNAYWIDRDTNLPGANHAPVPHEPDFLPSLQRTLELIDSDKRSVCAVLTVPSYEYSVPYALAMTYRRQSRADFLAVSRAEALEQYASVERDMRLLEQRGELRIADPKSVLCPTDQCLNRGPSGASLYRDRHHLSTSGASLVSSVLETCIQDAGL